MVPNKVSIVFISACFVRYSHYCCNKYGTYSTFSSVSFCVCVYERASDTTLEGVVTHNTLRQHTSTFNMLIGSCSHEKQAQIPGSGMNERTNKSNPDQNRPNQTEQSPANPNNRNKPASQWEKKGTRARKQMHLTIRRTAEYDKPRCQGQGKSAVLEINKPG